MTLFRCLDGYMLVAGKIVGLFLLVAYACWKSSHILKTVDQDPAHKKELKILQIL